MLLGVAALHGLVLHRLAVGTGGEVDDTVRAAKLPVSVRSVLAPAAAPPAPPAPLAVPVATTPARRELAERQPAPRSDPRPAEPAAEPAAEPTAVLIAEPTAPAASVAVTPAAVDPAPEPASAPAADPGGEVIPVYATRLPPAADLRYVLRRGLLSGSGALIWAPEADGRYQARLEASAFGQPLIAQISRGHIDAHGLAPDRFTDRRRSRAELAANFQREAGKLTYSGPSVEFPLPPGAQDRVSWLVQLGAVLAADPALQAEGAAVRLFVTGARGDADVWTFAVQGRETQDLPAGTVPDALHVLRRPRRAFDTQADAWLDPARGYLPVRVRLATPDSGDVTELVLSHE